MSVGPVWLRHLVLKLWLKLFCMYNRHTDEPDPDACTTVYILTYFHGAFHRYKSSYCNSWLGRWRRWWSFIRVETLQPVSFCRIAKTFRQENVLEMCDAVSNSSGLVSRLQLFLFEDILSNRSIASHSNASVKGIIQHMTFKNIYIMMHNVCT